MLPAHVAADFDVVRLEETTSVLEGLATHGDVIIAGPSGSGKSALLRRCAPLVSTGARVLRVLRIRDDDDTELLVRHVRRQLPSRKAESAAAERRRLVDLYQAGLIDLVELQRRAKELDARRRDIDCQRAALADQRRELATDNRLRQRVGSFAERALAAFDGLDFDQRQRLMRLVVEEVKVTGWQVDVRLRIPLDEDPADNGPGRGKASSHDRLRSLRSRPT